MDDQESSVKPTSTLPPITGMGSRILAGRRFLDSYLATNESGPLVLPAVPTQKHVDHYNEDDLKVNRKKDYDTKRIDNEAECAVYRTLENLKQKIIVIHGFSYSKDQWDMLLNNSEEKGMGREGEHDFLVIVPNCTLICIEVKRPKSEKKFRSLYKEATRQANQCGQFLKSLLAPLKLPFKEFCAFPLTCRDDGMKSDIKEHNIDIPILWKDNIGPSLSEYTTNSNVWRTTSDIEALIVGLWLENQGKRGMEGIDEIWDLFGKTIKQTNDQLKSQELYLKSLNRSCNLKKVPKEYKAMFQNHLHGIEYVTQEQLNLLCQEDDDSFKQSYVLVNGCAGSGKTLIMYARILRLLHCMKYDEQILLLLPWWDAADVFMKMIEKFDKDISMKKMDLVGYLRKSKDQPDIIGSFTKQMKECTEKIVIFVRPNFILRDFISQDLLNAMHSIFLATLKNRKWHIFCDDFHSSFAHSMVQAPDNLDASADACTKEPLADFLLNLLSKNGNKDNDCVPQSLWISCDLMQTVQFSFWMWAYDQYQGTIDKIYGLFKKHQICRLSGNLRNAHGIALILSDLKEKFLDLCGDNREKIMEILPSQGSYHFIQGFTTKLYCVTENNMGKVKSIVTNELNLIDRSYQATEISNMIAVIPVYHHVSVVNEKMSGARGDWSMDIQKMVEHIACGDKMRTFDKNLHFADYVKYANSMEFPCAVIVVDLSCSGVEVSAQDMNRSLMNILSHVYVGISRAKVYCSIILICSDDKPNELYKEVLQVLLPHVKIIEDY